MEAQIWELHVAHLTTGSISGGADRGLCRGMILWATLLSDACSDEFVIETPRVRVAHGVAGGDGEPAVEGTVARTFETLGGSIGECATECPSGTVKEPPNEGENEDENPSEIEGALDCTVLFREAPLVIFCLRSSAEGRCVLCTRSGNIFLAGDFMLFLRHMK